MSDEDYGKLIREETPAVYKASRKAVYHLELAIAGLIEQLNVLYAPETFGKNGFVLKCLEERPRMLSLLKAFDKTSTPVQPGLLGILEDIKGEKARNPAATTYDRAKAYDLLRRMVGMSGGDVGPTNTLEALKLTQYMPEHFESENKARDRGR